MHNVIYRVMSAVESEVMFSNVTWRQILTVLDFVLILSNIY